MATEKRVLRTELGVVLTELRLNDDAGLVDVAYTVSSKRTPEVPGFSTSAEAKAAFDAEVAVCRKAS